MHRKPSIYLGGSMTLKADLGAKWRDHKTPLFEDLGYKVENPCHFEQDIWKPEIRAHGCEHMRELKLKDVDAHSAIMEKIEYKDVSTILQCDEVLFLLDIECFAKFNEKTKHLDITDGTSYELKDAYHAGKSMWFIVDMPLHDLPSWMLWRVVKYGKSNNRLFYHWRGFEKAFTEYTEEKYGKKLGGRQGGIIMESCEALRRLFWTRP